LSENSSHAALSAGARGIAEADSVGIATIAQAARPISNNRFILDARTIAARQQCSTGL
jgi:hypothetical protein